MLSEKKPDLVKSEAVFVKIYPDFDIRNYNYSRLSSYLKDFESLNVVTRNKAVWVSLNGSSIQDVESQIAIFFIVTIPIQ